MSAAAAMAMWDAARVGNRTGGSARNRKIKFHPFLKSREFLKAYKYRTD
jgi:hypothetical protein